MSSHGGDDLPGSAIDVSADPTQRRELLPRWTKAMVAVSLVSAALSMLFSALLFSHVEKQRRERIADQSRAFVESCERERLVVSRLIDTKRSVGLVAGTLRVLILGVAEQPDPTPADIETRRALKVAADDLLEQTTGLAGGRRALLRELARVDCENLPAAQPFRP